MQFYRASKTSVSSSVLAVLFSRGLVAPHADKLLLRLPSRRYRAPCLVGDRRAGSCVQRGPRSAVLSLHCRLAVAATVYPLRGSRALTVDSHRLHGCLNKVIKSILIIFYLHQVIKIPNKMTKIRGKPSQLLLLLAL